MEKIKIDKKILIILAITVLLLATFLYIGSSAYADEQEYEYSLFGGNIVKDNKGGWFVKGVLTLGIPDEFYLDYWEASTDPDYTVYQSWEEGLTEEEVSYKETIDINLNKKTLGFNTLTLSDKGILHIQITVQGEVYQDTSYWTKYSTKTWITVSKLNSVDYHQGTPASGIQFRYYTLRNYVYQKEIGTNGLSSPGGTNFEVNEDISSYLQNGESYYVLVSQEKVTEEYESNVNYKTSTPVKMDLVQSYTLNFNTVNNGTISSVTQAVGTSYIMPNPPQVPTNTTFENWVNLDYGLSANAGETIAPEEALTYNWVARYKYNIPQVTRLENEFIVSGSSFNYEYQINSETPVAFDQEDEYPSITTGQTIKFRGISSDSHIYYSDWTSSYSYQAPVVNYTLTYNTNGGNLPTGTDNNITTGYLPNPLPQPTKEGFTFNGWYIDNTFTVEAVPGNQLIGNTILYAKWIQNGSTPGSYVIQTGFYKLPEYYHVPTSIFDEHGETTGFTIHGISNYEEIEMIIYEEQLSSGQYIYYITYETDNGHLREIYKSVRYNTRPTEAVLERNNRTIEYYTITVTEPVELTEDYFNLWNNNVEKGLQSHAELEELIFAVAEAPVKMVKQMLNFEVLGVNLANLFLGILTLGLLIWILKKLR